MNKTRMPKRRFRALLALPALVAPFMFATAAPASAAGGCAPQVYLYKDAYGYINASHTVKCDMWTYKLRIDGMLQRTATNTLDFADTVATYTNKAPGTYSGYGTRLRNYGGTYCATTWATVTYPATSQPFEYSFRGCASF